MYINIYVYRKHKLPMMMFWSLLGGAHIQSGQRRENAEELQHWEHIATFCHPWIAHGWCIALKLPIMTNHTQSIDTWKFLVCI